MSRVYDQGSLVRISLSPDDIREWKRRWPGSGIPSSRSISFTFEKKNGDLVDVSTRYDGSDLAAMSQDAYNVWLEKRHKNMVRAQGEGVRRNPKYDRLHGKRGHSGKWTTPLRIEKWEERDRLHIALEDANGRTIIEWWDEEARDAIEDGFLKPRDLLGSATEYAQHMGLL